MKKKLGKICFSAVLSLAVILPVMANTTTVTVNAEVDDFLVVQIERVGGAVASGDDFHRSSSDPATDEILNFGTIDARGISPGSLSSTNSTSTGIILQTVLLDASQNIYPLTSPPTHIAGALYYIKGEYQIRTVRSPGPTGEEVTDVDVYNDGPIPAFVNLSSTNAMLADASTASGVIAAGSIRVANSGVAAKTELIPNNPNNNPVGIDIGLYVDNATPALPGVQETTLTFTGT